MSGIIAYAELKYRRKSITLDTVVWATEIINKRSNQSDRGFVRAINKLMKKKGELPFKEKFETKKSEMKFFDNSENEIPEEIIKKFKE